MPSADTADAAAWIRQAVSDLRVARSLQESSEIRQDDDVGCHLAALCSQALEKSIKGYFILCGNKPALKHRVDKYVMVLLRAPSRYKDHYRKISALFDSGTRCVITRLANLTPGTGDEKNVPNTEYPWGDSGDLSTPVGADIFSDRGAQRSWINATTRVVTLLQKLQFSVSRIS